MPDPLLPGPEALLGAFYRNHPSLAPLHGGRVGTRLGGVYPAIRLARLGSPPGHRWEDRPTVQVECWADEQAQADLLARTVVAVTPEVLGAHLQGVVSGWDITLGPLWSPDPTTARARYLIDVQLQTHPS